MALEYTLELATKQSPEDVLDALCLLDLGFRKDPTGQLVSRGVTVTAASETELGRSIIVDAYQLDPTVYLKFRLDKFDDWSAGLQSTITATLELLRKIGADGILLVNGEIPVLMSVHGVLTLNKAHDLWKQPALLSLVNEPFSQNFIAPL